MLKTSTQTAVRVENLTKTFRIPTESSSGLKQRLINLLKGKKGYREFTPLSDISFEIEKGDFFGIVGRNGSGKSTLLKSIANIYTPTKGSVQVDGTLVPFIELGVGFNPELTGRENVFLNGALLGFSREEMTNMYDEIVAFAEISEFMDEKLKNYSSGMQVRLAFSIAIQAQGDVLLLDEVLAVGDEAFQRKCFEYFAQLKRDKKTVILVTHDMNSVARFCNKAMLIDNGNILEFGGIKDVVRGYEKLNSASRSNSKPVAEDVVKKPHSQYGTIAARLNDSDSKRVHVAAAELLRMSAQINPNETLEDVFFGLTIQKTSGEYVYWYTTEKDKNICNLTKDKPVYITMDIQNIFGDGEYTVNMSVKKNDRTVDYIMVNDAVMFTVSGWDQSNGWMYHPDVDVKVTQQAQI